MIQRTQLSLLPISGHNLLTMMGLYYHSVAHTPVNKRGKKSPNKENRDSSRRDGEPTVLLTFSASLMRSCTIKNVNVTGGANPTQVKKKISRCGLNENIQLFYCETSISLLHHVI